MIIKVKTLIFCENFMSTMTFTLSDRSQLRTTGHQQIHTGYLQDVERTITGQTVYQRTSNDHPPDIFIRWRLFEVEHVLTRNTFA